MKLYTIKNIIILSTELNVGFNTLETMLTKLKILQIWFKVDFTDVCIITTNVYLLGHGSADSPTHPPRFQALIPWNVSSPVTRSGVTVIIGDKNKVQGEE